MNDVINRKDAIGAILSVGHIAELSDGDAVIRVSVVNYVLRNLPSAQSEPKSYRMGYQAGYAAAQRWTPVSKKFPPEDKDVLLQFPSNQCVGYYEDGGWMVNTGDGIYCIVGDNEEKPIAWIPLPVPYCPEGEDHEKD